MESSGLVLMEWIGYGIAVIGTLAALHYVWRCIKWGFRKISSKD